MKQFKVIRKAAIGAAPQTSVIIGDVTWNVFSTGLSKELMKDTNTVPYNSYSIFDFGDSKFSRGDAFVRVNLEEFDWHHASAKEFRAEIVRRVSMIESAFNEKYPEINEVAETTETAVMGTASRKIPSFASVFQGTQSFNECSRVTDYKEVGESLDGALMEVWEIAHDEFTPELLNDMFAVFTTSSNMHVVFFNKCVLIFDAMGLRLATGHTSDYYSKILERDNAVVAIYNCPSLFIFNNVSV